MGFFDKTVATEAHVNAPWGGNKKNFRCRLCGYRLKVGDTFQCYITNGTSHKPGNPMVCETCNTEDVLERWDVMWEELEKIKEKFWWFFLER